MLTDDLSTNLIPYMPHVLAMQREGTTFPNYILSDSLCCPSRASMLTGRYPHDTHVVSNEPPTGGFATFHDLGDENSTFATALAAVGYRTALMGKYLNGYGPTDAVDGRTPYVPPGWSEWDAAGDHAYRGYNYALAHNRTVQNFGSAPQDYLNTVLDRRAQSFVTASAAANRPFLLEVSTYTPHRPYAPAPSDVGTYTGVPLPRTAAFNRLPTDPPPWLAAHPPLTKAQIRTLHRDYVRRVEAVQSVDRMIRDLDRTVTRTGQASNTVFVFATDNGFHLGEHRLLPGKFTAYDTDIRVPLIVAGPGVAAGVRDPAMVQNVDLAPTFERLAHAAVPAAVDGRSLLPLLHGGTPARWPTLALIEHQGPLTARTEVPRLDPDFPQAGSGNPPTYQAIRSRDFAYVRYSDGSREYYNVRNDPAELHNVYGSLSHGRRHQLDREVLALADCHDGATCQRARYVRTP